MREASFHLFDRAAWPRSGHFEYYIRTVKCRYDLTAHLTVTTLRERGKSLGLRFYPLLLYIAARAVNANREFRMGFNEHRISSRLAGLTVYSLMVCSTTRGAKISLGKHPIHSM